MSKLSFNEFKAYIRKGAYLCDEGADHTLTPITFDTKNALLEFLIAEDKEEFFHDSVLHQDCARIDFETFNDQLVIMHSYMPGSQIGAKYTICTYIELYCDYLRLDTFGFNFAQIAKLELDGVLNENSDG